MSNIFDGLIDDFLNPKKKALGGETLRMITELSKTLDTDQLHNEVVKRLGKPNQIIKVIENGVEVIEYIWNTPEGEYKEVVMNSVPTNNEVDLNEIWNSIKESVLNTTNIPLKFFGQSEQEMSQTELEFLGKKLEEAIETEDYVEAVALRDKIKSINDGKSK